MRCIGTNRFKDCKLTWKEGPYEYIVKKKIRDADDWDYISTPLTYSNHTFEDLKYGEDYTFSVVTVSSLGASNPAQLPWRHVGMYY